MATTREQRERALDLLYGKELRFRAEAEWVETGVVPEEWQFGLGRCERVAELIAEVDELRGRVIWGSP